MARDQLSAMIDLFVAGYLAQELIYGYPMPERGFSPDMQEAKRLARLVASKWNAAASVEIFIRAGDGEQGHEETGEQRIEREVETILEQSHNRA